MFTQTYRVDGSPVTVHCPENDDDLVAFRAFINAGNRVMGLDTETTGLGIFGPTFRCRLVQFGDGDTAYVLRADQFADQIRQTLARPDRKWVAHNAPFDLLVLDTTGLATLEDLGPRVYDTYILAHLLDPRTANDGGPGLKLKELSAIYVDNDAADTQEGLNAVFLELYRAWKKTVSTEQIAEAERNSPKRPHIAWGFSNIDIKHPLYVLYAWLDVIYATRLFVELTTLILKGNRQSDLAKFEHRVQLLTTAQQRRGLLIDVPYTEQLVVDLRAEAERHVYTAASFGVENVNSTKQVTEALLAMGEEWSATTAAGKPAVGKDTLNPMADIDARSWERLGNREPNPLADAIIRAKRAEKWAVAYAEAFLHGRDSDDKIHPFVKALAARTARMSVSNPPLQQLPSSDWTIRRAIIAAPGQTIAAADYKSMELRVLAALAEVKEMKDAIMHDRDLHDFTATLIYGEGFTKNHRRLAKGVGLGKVFGGGAAGLAKQIGAPLDQVKYAVNKYDEVYPEVRAYGNRLQRAAARGSGAVVTPIGRRIPLDRDRAYAATNYVVQSTARDLIAQALIRIDEAGMSKHVLLPVHDELICTFPSGEVADGIAEIGRLMKSDFLGVPIDSDPEVYGPSWGHGYGAPSGI